MPRKPAARDRRAAYYSQQIAAAPTGAEALDAAWNWLKAALSQLDAHNPGEAERARRSLAAQLASFAKDADPKRR